MNPEEFDAEELVGREKLVRELSDALRNYKRPFFVVHGAPGVGKTALVRAVIQKNAKQFGVVDWLTGAPVPDKSGQIASPLQRANWFLKERAYGSLLVIDDAEWMDYADEAASQLFYHEQHRAVIFISRHPIKLRYANFTLEVPPVPLSAWMKSAAQKLGRKQAEQLEAVLNRTQLRDIPSAAFPYLFQLWSKQGGSAFENLLHPIDSSGLFGADGRPITGGKPAPIITAVTSAERELIKAVNKNPDLLHELTPRKFEEFVAELMRQQGFTVELTPATRDGGKDVYLAAKQSIGSFLYLVECKQYKQRPVGIGCVQRLYGAIEAERATGGLVVTTSHFSKPAETFQESVQYRLSLVDYLKLKGMIADVAGDRSHPGR
jgi:restriction endonuclease/AAA ATPase-like protein